MNFRLTTPAGVQWNGALIVSLVAILAVGAVGLASMPGIFSAMATQSPETDASEALDKLLPMHEEVASLNKDRFTGRSPFFVPRRPPERPRERPRTTPKTNTPPPPPREPAPAPGPPATYQGPKPTSLLGSAVYFRDFDDWVEVGTEESGVKVLEVVDSWHVSLGHRGGEYLVSIWGEPEDDFFKTAFEGKIRSKGFIPRESTASRPNPASSRSPGGRSATNRTTPGKATRSSQEMMPDPLEPDEIARMNASQARDAMENLLRARELKDLQPQDRARIERELQLVRKRLRPSS